MICWTSDSDNLSFFFKFEEYHIATMTRKHNPLQHVKRIHLFLHDWLIRDRIGNSSCHVQQQRWSRWYFCLTTIRSTSTATTLRTVPTIRTNARTGLLISYWNQQLQQQPYSTCISSLMFTMIAIVTGIGAVTNTTISLCEVNSSDNDIDDESHIKEQPQHAANQDTSRNSCHMMDELESLVENGIQQWMEITISKSSNLFPSTTIGNNKNNNSCSTGNIFPNCNLSSDENFQQIVNKLFQLIVVGTGRLSSSSSTDPYRNDHVGKDDNVIVNEDATKVTPATTMSSLLQEILLENRKRLATPVGPQQQPHPSTNDTLDSLSSSIEENTNNTILMVQQQDNDDTSIGIFDLYHLLNTYSSEIHQLVSKYMSYIDYQRITPTAILYYVDTANTQYESILQERLQNHSITTSIKDTNHPFSILLQNWTSKEIQDQIVDFFDDIIINTSSKSVLSIQNQAASTTQTIIDSSIIHTIKKHQDGIDLAKLSYGDTVNEIRDGLQHISSESSLYKYRLIQCDLKSEPGKPAHFYAIRTRKNKEEEAAAEEEVNNNSMDIVIVIRGTKTVADAITDLLCDTQPYRPSKSHSSGTAHSYILDSGKYIANRYKSILYDILNKKEKTGSNEISKVNVTIYGHSLGAGAGAIAAMELHDLHDDRIHVEMVGYGCPALLSKELAKETTDYITTFINDSDLVPRLSGKSLTNLLYDIIEFDWLSLAKQDIQNVLSELQQRQPIVFTNDALNAMTNIVYPILQSIYTDTYVESGTIPRFHVELYPPGKCIHIYRSRTNEHTNGRMACYVPNWFYSKIDVNKHMVDDHLLQGGYIDAIDDIVHRKRGEEWNHPK